VLKHNNFTFNGEHFLQINGTVMGTKMAPSYANIFMGKLEKLIIQSAPGAIFVPITVPLICKKCSPLNVKLLCFSTNVSNWTRHSVGGSSNGHPTEQISEFIDFHLRPPVEALPSHLKDTTDYLQKMESMNESVLVDMTIFFHNV
jgi:hypothetical protein